LRNETPHRQQRKPLKLDFKNATQPEE